jgi:hypothetical protein
MKNLLRIICTKSYKNINFGNQFSQNNLILQKAMNETIFRFYFFQHLLADNSKLVSSFSVSFLIGCTALNILTLFLYKRRKREHCPLKTTQQTGHNNNSNISERIERNLLIYAMGTFAGHALITLMMVFKIGKIINLPKKELIYANSFMSKNIIFLRPYNNLAITKF